MNEKKMGEINDITINIKFTVFCLNQPLKKKQVEILL